MPPERETSLRIVLLGLPADVSESLAQTVSKWGGALNARDSGTAHYRTAPFDLSHIQGLLQTTPNIACC